MRIEWVTPASSSQWRVSCTTRSPASSDALCRSISYSKARPSDRIEFMFLTSTLVPSSLAPTGRNDTLASIRNAPSSIFTSETPIACRMPRSSFT